MKNRFNHRNDGIRNASLILRQIRNAFAHDPLNPTWDIRQPEAMNKILVVKDIIKLDTKEINGKRIQRLHYGGPLAILKLSEFIRMKLS